MSRDFDTKMDDMLSRLEEKQITVNLSASDIAAIADMVAACSSDDMGCIDAAVGRVAEVITNKLFIPRIYVEAAKSGWSSVYEDVKQYVQNRKVTITVGEAILNGIFIRCKNQEQLSALASELDSQGFKLCGGVSIFEVEHDFESEGVVYLVMEESALGEPVDVQRESIQYLSHRYYSKNEEEFEDINVWDYEWFL